MTRFFAGIPVDEGHTISPGKELEDGHTVADNHIKRESPSELVLRLHGSNHTSGKTLTGDVKTFLVESFNQAELSPGIWQV